jgi:hypothetical protein
MIWKWNKHRRAHGKAQSKTRFQRRPAPSAPSEAAGTTKPMDGLDTLVKNRFAAPAVPMAT